MAEGFDSFNAPKFFDFSKKFEDDDDDVDKYFETHHEGLQEKDPLADVDIENIAINEYYVKSKEIQDDLVYYSPLKETQGYNLEFEKNCKKELRRSMSVGQIPSLYITDELYIKGVNEKMYGLSLNKNKSCPEKTTPSNNLSKNSSSMSLNKVEAGTSAACLTRVTSKEYLNRLAQPKKYHSAQCLNQDNYVSMAEAVRKFQNGTPTRFRMRPKLEKFSGKHKPTIAESPFLRTKSRHRSVHALSRDEQEQLELEEAQKFKFKANPLNKKILQGPLKPLVPIEKKPATVVKEFKLTCPPKKIADSPKKSFEFHAKPVPKVVYEPHKQKEVHKIAVTQPRTPTFMKKYAQSGEKKPRENQEEPKNPVKHHRTVPVPFSFDKRDQGIQKRREELIKKALEEEQKAREFHARPVPKSILNSGKHGSLDPSSSSSKASSTNELSRSEEGLATQFKARPATVLHKKPFQPKREERRLVEITEFELNTEKRAKEREEFEILKKEKEERIALARKLEEEKRMREEEEEVARLRKETEYKAQGIRKYKEVQLKPSGKVTTPISPKFGSGCNRNHENKENLHES